MAKFLLKVRGKVEDAAHVLVSQYFLLATGPQTQPTNFCWRGPWVWGTGGGRGIEYYKQEGFVLSCLTRFSKEEEDQQCFHLVFESIFSH